MKSLLDFFPTPRARAAPLRPALHHKDPFDRQIIAQALSEAMPVVTVDPFFKLYEGVEAIW